MLQFSIEDPAAYWQTALKFLSVKWRKWPQGYVDLARGKEFPRWFPDGELNWVDTVLAHADDPFCKHRTAIIAEHETADTGRLTFEQLSQQVRQFAAGLTRRGVKAGDRIGLLMENGVEASISLLSLAFIGATVVPLFSGFGVDAAFARLSAANVTGLIATDGFFRRGRWVDTTTTVRALAERARNLKWVIWKGARAKAETNGIPWEEVADSAAAAQSYPRSPNDPFMIIYTSGTTGKPKGVVHTHGGFPLKIAHDAAVHFDLGSGDVLCWPADMGWIAGALTLSAALMRGATLVCYDGAPDYPDWSRMVKLIEDHRVTHFGATPTLIRGLATNEAISTAGDVSSIRLLITAGERIDPEHFVWYQKSFGRNQRPVINYTGGTEVSGALLSSVVVRPIAAAGFNTASPAVDVAVVDATGKEIVERVGELAVRAPFVGMTQSFWQDDERYLDAYWRAVPGMWIHGDLALRTRAGDVFMQGRSDDTLKLAGKRLGPAEVEDLLLELPYVREAAAIGVDDPVKGQRLVVFIIRSDPSPDPERLVLEVSDHVGSRLGKPFRPASVHIVTELPKTRSFKVMRRLIRDIYCDRPIGDLSSLDNPSALDEIRRAASTAVLSANVQY
jgi:acetyl-CoA synthetase